MKFIKLALFTPNVPSPATNDPSSTTLMGHQRADRHLGPRFAKASRRHLMVSFLGFVTALASHHRSVMNAQNTFTRNNPKRNDTHIGAFRTKHKDETTRNTTIRTSEPSKCNKEMFRSAHNRKRPETRDAKVRRCPAKNVDAQNSDNRSYCVHQNNKMTLLQSFLDSKGRSNHQETHGKEILTRSVVLKHKKSSPTVSEREGKRVKTFSN